MSNVVHIGEAVHRPGASAGSNVVHIGEAARSLGVTAGYLRLLERQGRIPPARRDLNGRIYSGFDLALLRALGVGSKPTRLRPAEEVVAQQS